MNIRKLSFKTTTVLFLLGAALLLGSSMVYAEESCEIIRITKIQAGGGSRILIRPEKVTVSVGTCTVWINLVRRGDLRVSFRENAKQCILSTDEATGFEELKLEGGESCYASETLPRGKTASLVWSTPGTYKYTLETPATTTKTGTQISVRNIHAEGVIEVIAP